MDEIYEMEACKFDARSISMSLCGESNSRFWLPVKFVRGRVGGGLGWMVEHACSVNQTGIFPLT